MGSHLTECAECTAIVHDYQLAIEHIALTVPLYRAPPRLKERILGAVSPFGLPAILTSVRRSWAMSAAAVVLVGFALGGLLWGMLLSAEVSRLRKQNQELVQLSQLDAEQRTTLLQLQAELNSARREQQRTLQEYATLVKIALDPDLIPTDLQGVEPFASASCSYVWSTKQSLGALTCKNLPQTALSAVYELWATKGSATLALGSFVPSVDGTAVLAVVIPQWAPGPVTSLWVTIEPANTNRDRPSQQVVLVPSPSQQAQR